MAKGKKESKTVKAKSKTVKEKETPKAPTLPTMETPIAFIVSGEGALQSDNVLLARMQSKLNELFTELGLSSRIVCGSIHTNQAYFVD